VLLRRMTKHVREQNWSDVALELVIVVVGVFIGIQAANWNERRVEQRQEADILLGIAADVRRDLDELRIGSAIMLTGIGAGNYALAAIGEAPTSTSSFGGIPADIPDIPEPTEDQKDRLWSLLIAAYFPGAATTAYDVLMSTGNLGIISDPDLVDAIQNYYRLHKGMERTHDGTMRPLRNDMLEIGRRFGLSPSYDLPEAELLALLAEDEELRTAYRNQLGYKILQYGEQELIMDVATEILERIDDEAGSNPLSRSSS